MGDEPPEKSDYPWSRHEALIIIKNLVEIARHKGENGRVKNRENERIRQGWIRVAIAGMGVYITGLRDDQLDDIDERLTALENPVGTAAEGDNTS